MVPPSTGAIDQVREPSAGAAGVNTPINVVADPASTVIEAGLTDSFVPGGGGGGTAEPPPQPVIRTAIRLKAIRRETMVRGTLNRDAINLGMINLGMISRGPIDESA